MTNRAQRRMASRQGTWAGVEFWYNRAHDESTAQTATRVAQGIEGQRQDLLGIIPTFFADMSGGMVRRAGLHSSSNDLNQVWYNEGLQTHVPFQLTQGYKVVTQATLLSGDYSGYRAANKRVRGVMFGGRMVFAIGSQILTDTSASDPALTVPGTSDGITDTITAMWTGMVGTTPALFVSTDGTTDDTQYTTDPFASTISWTKFVTQSNAADQTNAAQYFPLLGGGYHVMVGRFGNSPSSGLGVWAVSKDATLPASPKPVVYTATKNVEDPNGTTYTTSAMAPSFYYGEQYGSVGWTNLANITASDNSRARSPGAAAGDNVVISLYTHGWPTVAQGIGDSDLITGIQHSVEFLVGSDVHTSLSYVRPSIQLGATAVGVSFGDTFGVSTSDQTNTYGSTTNRLGANLTGADVKQLVLRDLFGLIWDGSGINIYADVDYVSLTLTYKPLGTQVFLKSGGYTCGPLPGRPNTLVYIEPETDDETGVTKTRRPVFINLEYDSVGNRVTASLEYPDVGLSNIEDASSYLGGVAFTGDKSSGLGKQLKTVDSNGRVAGYNFPGFHGSHTVGIATMFDEGPSLLLDVADEDGSQAQWWRLVDTKFHASYPLQSKSNTIASLPLAWAERTLHKAQNRVYRFFPVSTTNLACAYSFVPRNPSTDVLNTNTTEVKQDGPLYLITPEFEIGQVENESTLMLIRHEGDLISATSGAYGTVKYDAELSTDSTTIDSTFASPDVTTGALNTPFQEYQVPSSGKPFRTVQFRITMDNARSSSVKTANALPWYVETKSSRPHLSLFRVYIDWDNTRMQTDDWLSFVARLKAASATQSINDLELGGVGVPAALVGWSGEWLAEDIEQPFNHQAPDSKGQPAVPWLLFQEVRGQISA